MAGKPGARKDYTGERYGQLTVIGEYIPGQRKPTGGYTTGTWLVRCDCGEERRMESNRFVSGNSTSCGHDNYQRLGNLARSKAIQLSPGDRTSLLVYVREDGYRKGCRWIIVQCDCGSPEKSIDASTFISESIKSCGCYNREMAVQRGRMKKGPAHNRDKGIDHTGEVFGQLTVLGRAPRGIGEEAKFTCLCTCGNKKDIRGKELRSGQQKSCGCSKKLGNPKSRWKVNQ